MANGKITFTADASGVSTASAEARRSVASVATSAEEARQRIVESYKMQVQAAKDAGASQRELEAITRRTSSMLSQVTDDSATRYINALERMEASTSKFNAARKKLAEAVPVAAPDEHYTVSRQSQASASIRALGGTPSVRAAESFAASVPLLSKAFELAFPVVGAAVFTAEIARGVSELIKMKKEADELPEHIRDGFSSLTAPLILTVDTLRKANDELEITIANLEHKPASTLALAIDDARINADRLAESANTAYANVKKLLEENKVGFGSFLLSGQISSGPVTDEVNKRMKSIRDAQVGDRTALRSGSDTPEAAAGRDAKITAQLTDLYNWAHKTRTDIQSFSKDGKTEGIQNILSGIEDYSSNTLDERSEGKRNIADQVKVKELQDQKKQADLSKQIQQKAIADQKQQWDYELAAWKASGQRSAQEVSRWWALKAIAEAAGSINFNDAMRKANDETVKVISDTTRQTAEFKKSLQSLGQSQSAEVAAGPDLSGADAAVKNYAIWTNNVARHRDAQQQNVDALQQATIQTQLANGEITKQQAAFQTAALHAKEYADALANIREQQEALDANPKLTDSERKAGQSSIDLQTTQLGGKQAVQDVQDQAQIAANSWSGQFKRANQEWVGELNSNLAALMTGQKASWSGFFASIGQSIAKIGLNNLESALSGGGDKSQSGGGGGGFFGAVLGAFTGRAIGGDVDANSSYLVGERGPEVLTMGSQSGRITPNNQLGGTTHNYTVDARGSHDPAATEAAVRRGIAAATPHIIAASRQSDIQDRRRSPQGRRS
jgi:hypothetical protein